jgi:hypothetical protein
LINRVPVSSSETDDERDDHSGKVDFELHDDAATRSGCHRRIISSGAFPMDVAYLALSPIPKQLDDPNIMVNVAYAYPSLPRQMKPGDDRK